MSCCRSLPLHTVAVVLCVASLARAQDCGGGDPPDPSFVEWQLRFDRVYTGHYRTGEAYDTVTIRPDGLGETLEDMGITVRFRLACPHEPLAGIPAEDIVLWSSLLHFCAPKHPDHDTDADGWSQFSGTIAGGGCASSLDLFAKGIFQGTLQLHFNSTDTVTASPGFTDMGDLAVLAERLGKPAAWDICFDYNESGPPAIDASDLAYFASCLGAACE